MLRRLRIGGRLNLLIAVPLLALVIFAALSYYSINRASVRGAEYKQLKLAQDLRADVIPPPASLLEAWAQVNHIGVLAASPDGFSADTLVEINTHFVLIQRAHDDFDAAMTWWGKQALPQRVQIRLVEMGGAVGERFFDEVENSLKPAVAAQDAPRVLEIIRGMEWRYDLQQSGVQRSLQWAEPEVVTREADTESFVKAFIVYAGAGTAILLLLTFLFSLIVRRSIVDPLRRLAEQAKIVAGKELPDAVEAMQDSSATGDVPHLASFDVGTRDEIAELGASFNAVQDVAVDLAAEQAIARRVVSQNLINIARRNQNLLGRTLGFISSLEQGERDPEALDNLFRLDHLTTRMRRNAQSLLVLAGAEPTRLWSPAVAIGDVVRAALSEVENYGQVELADLGEIGVIGSAAGEVAHLLAELLENATSFSPPTSPVTVVGRAVPDGHQLAIFDYGLGMTPEDLADANRRLNQVSAFDRESNKMLGFQVVARLAARYDIKVMLTTTPGGNGVTAIVRLPKALLEAVGTTNSSAPVLDVPAMSERLSEPLTINASGGSGLSDAAPAAMPQETPTSSVPVLAALSSIPSLASNKPEPTDAPTARTPAVPAESGVDLGQLAGSFAPLTTESGLTKRVRGAQLPELGATQAEPESTRAPEEVRNTLASLQRGIDLGRQRNSEG